MRTLGLVLILGLAACAGPQTGGTAGGWFNDTTKGDALTGHAPRIAGEPARR